MYFSYREKKILELLVEYRNGVTVEELKQLLQVSRRTIYREISSIEATLAQLQIQIVKPRGAGYRLVGEEFQIEELKRKLSLDEEEAFDTVERQQALAVVLLLAEEELTMEALAIDFEVSVSTVNADLTVIETTFPDYQLQLERRKSRGVIVVGGEKERRQILSSLIYTRVNEYDFFQYMHQLTSDAQPLPQNFFLQQVSPRSLFWAKQIILHNPDKLFTEVIDNQLQQILLILAISIDRIVSGHMLSQTVDSHRIRKDSLQVARQIMNFMEQQLGETINENERNFFARQLEGLNYKIPQNIFLESFDVELSYKIKELIRLTAGETGIDFRKDETLFYDLMAHMAAALKRPVALGQQHHNPLLEKVINEYHQLYLGVKKALKQVFPEHELSQDELGYIVIHFATSLERNPGSRDLAVLVLCSSGVGTAKILESRILKFLPEVEQVEVARISQMERLHFEQYDMILSTIFLPGFQLPYKVISPLLLDDEIQEIRQYIKQEFNSELPAKKEVVIPQQSAEEFDDIYQTMKVANNLLKQFDMKQVTSQATLEETLLAILKELEGFVVTDAEKVAEQVIQRYLVAPIGIPNSNIALFHSANAWVKMPYFGIYELDQTFPILGMDKQSIELKRILLMLAPDPLSPEDQHLLGKISSSVIESDLNTEIYKHGSKEIIYQLLSSLFVGEIRNID